MHILTGLVLAGLLKRRQDDKQSPLLRLAGPVRTKHLLPGRVRFQVEAVARNGAAGDTVVEQIGRVQGVDSVDVTPVSGSVLINYDPETVAPEVLVAAIIRVLGLQDELERTPQPILARELREMGDAINRAVYDRSGGFIDLWTGVAVGLGAVGLGQLLTQRARSLPSGFTMLWWAYMALLRAGRSSG